MGLAGRKQKQRIHTDPRNLSWADDASRFGLSYLSKFGWDASQGLGSSGNGITTHLKVQQKLDMMGIGARHQRDPNGIAWTQNNEFEALLKRLNDSVEQANGEDTTGQSRSEHEMVKSGKTSAQEEKVEGRSRDASSVTTVKKRKRRDADDADASENTWKKQKKQKEKHQKYGSDISVVAAIGLNSDPSSEPSPSGPHSQLTHKPRPMAHRARIRAAKRIAGKSTSAISEILGIAPSSSVSSSTSTPAPTPPSSSTPFLQPSSLSLDNLTTSTKSVADYFKEKLLARSTAFSASSSSAPSGSATLGPGATRVVSGFSDISPPDNEDEPPRRGIGSQVPAIPPPQKVSELWPAFASGVGGGNADGRDMSEKLRRKAERKAEKRKQREADAKQSIPEKVEEDDIEGVQRMSKEKKKKKRRERKQQAPAGEQSHANDNNISSKSHEHDTPELIKKFQNEHEKKRS